LAAVATFAPHRQWTLARKIERVVVLLLGLKIVRDALALGRRRLWKIVVNWLLSSFKSVAPKSLSKSILDKAVDGELKMLEKKLLGEGDADAFVAIPSAGLSREKISTRARALKKLQRAFEEGTKWGGVYHDDRISPTLPQVQQELWCAFNSTNLLYPTIFPGVRKFEAEIVSMVLDMINGLKHGAVGLLSSGGTESILLAVLAYREFSKPAIEEPEIICGITAHPALYKACRYFGVKLVKVPIDPKTMQMSVSAVKQRLNRNTVAIYASAPTFTHGVIDPVEELAAIAKAAGVGLHVDNCLGGFLASYMSKEGLLKKRFDFSVDGVTSMSVDVHKYGFASKGVSVVAFRDPALRRATYMPSTDGCEGLYVTTTLQGSRPGGVVAQAWGTLLHIGDDGYRKSARDMHRVMEGAQAIVRETKTLRVLTKPDLCCVPITSDTIDIYKVASVMEKKGWNMFTGQNPPVMTLCVGEQHLKVLEKWGADLRDAVRQVEKNPNLKVEGNAAVYGAAASAPDDVLDDILRSYCDIRMRVKRRK